MGPCIIGETVSHYEIVEKLGEGGMGVVYKALDLRLRRFVALKFLSQQITASPETIARFELEARSISALNHPRIATIFAMEEGGLGRRFLVLEYLAGGTLRTRMKQFQELGQPYPVRDAVKIAGEIAEGLHHAHRAGIVHRDIKPENIMFTADGVLRIADFGLAKSTHSEEITRAGSMIGTAAYMAPEQASENHTSARSDLFSLGIVLHEMIAGQRPFAGKSELATLHALIHEAPARLRRLRPEVPPALEQIVLRMLDKDPARRYQSAADLSADFESVYNETTTAELNYDGVTRTMAGLLPRPRTIRWKLVAASLALIAAASGAAWSLLRPTPSVNAASTQLAVLPFTARTGSAEDVAFGNGLSDIVATRLSASGSHIWVVPGSDLRRNRVTTPDEARRVFGVRRVLSGTIERQGPAGALVEVRLIDTASGKTLKQARLSSGASGPTLQEEVMQQATAMLGVPPDSPEGRHLREHNADDTRASNAYDYYVLGNGYLQRYDQAGNTDAAIHSFQQAIRLDPGYALAYAGLSTAYWRKYKSTSDAQMLEQARDAAMQALSRNETLDSPHTTLGVIAVSAGRVDEGIRQLNMALERDPVSAEACRELANAYVQAGHLAEAESTYKRAIQYRPDFWLGYLDIATFYYDRGRYEEAEEALRKASRMTPDNYLVYRNLGAVEAARGEWTNAEASIQRALQLRPVGSVYSSLGAIYIYSGRYSEAIPVLQKAVALNVSDKYAYLPWGNLGDAYRLTSNRQADANHAYSQAIQLATQQLEVNPRDAGLLSLIAVYWAKSGQPGRAEKEIREALKIAPKDSSVLFQDVLIKELSGRRKPALAALADALGNGYSLSIVKSEPELALLRADPGYPEAASHAKVR